MKPLWNNGLCNEGVLWQLWCLLAVTIHLLPLLNQEMNSYLIRVFQNVSLNGIECNPITSISLSARVFDNFPPITVRHVDIPYATVRVSLHRGFCRVANPQLLKISAHGEDHICDFLLSFFPLGDNLLTVFVSSGTPIGVPTARWVEANVERMRTGQG